MADTLSLDEQTELLVAAASNSMPDKNFARNSDNWKRLRVVAGGVTDTHAHIDQVERDSNPLTASEESLGKKWSVVYKVPRKGATPASAESAGRIRGIDGAGWSATDVLVHKSGQTFRPISSGSLDESGEALVGIISISTGPATRLAAGEVLSWVTTPEDLEDEVALEADLDNGGTAEEDVGSWRNRILNRIAQPAAGGNMNDWRQWALASSDAIATAYVYPNRSGNGAVDMAALHGGRGSARLLTELERTALRTALDAVRPVSAQTRVLEVAAQPLAVELAIEPVAETRYLRDWDDSTPLEVFSWTPGTRTLQFASTRPPSMAVGHRLTVDATSGVELVIESLFAADSVVLQSARGQTPVAGAAVYSGGPLVGPARDAILAYFDALGPRKGAYGAAYWEDQFRLSRVPSVTGVQDRTWITPTTNVEPDAESYPDDDVVNLLVPGTVLVRYA